MLPGLTTWDALKFARRLHRALEEGRVGSVTSGLAEASDDATADALIAKADLALIEAKRSFRATLAYSSALAPAPGKPPRHAGRAHKDALAAALARAVDAKDPYTSSHCETVAQLCGMVATELGLTDDRVAAVRLAGLVHDVGKIGVPTRSSRSPRG